MKFTTMLIAAVAVGTSVCAGTEHKFGKPDYCVTQRPAHDSPSLPRRIGVLLFPAFELLDVFGPLEIISVLAGTYQLQLSLIAETMDPVSTRPLLAAMNRMNSSVFPEVLPTHTIHNAPALDVLLVPGGLGTRSPFINATLAYIKKTAPQVKYVITVCSGSLLAARAGILDGRTATTNKQSWNSTVKSQPQVNWVPHARWTVDGTLWTTSGISAGIDGVLGWVECVFGEEVARNTTVFMEYNREEDADNDPFAVVSGVY
ncbi:DJ-1/PfpI family protein [Massariosphaeria phaeospora]|uniref:DJ-1/PfpI family protein n=1 Tax=Massariosphaeria phaeospora TaxID=100035 RepID=A0A7C8IHW9_9PLEO|nr:DJ-1/PfpI family protein [Massariosphaeria phaeospora]